jgi:ATP-binding cassette subfamily F protein uup
LRNERAQRRLQQGTARLALEKGDASGKKVIEVDNICFGYGEKQIIKNFSALIQRGDKIGLIGANGAGKSTLLKLLLQQIEPNSGTVEQGTKLEIAYFDQLRDQLDPNLTVADTVADGNDFVEIAGNKRHVMSYLGDFLFAPARARSPVKSLSGGEKNRLLLARLFTKPANLIVMDEPTNDLDLETLELLEEKLVNYDGTLLLVSHDRAFLDNVVTSVFVLNGSGDVDEFVGGYTDWMSYVNQIEQTKSAIVAKKNQEAPKQDKQAVKKKRLSYKDQQELNDLPQMIDDLEVKQAALTLQISSSAFYKKEPLAIAKTLDELKSIETKLEQVYARWNDLEALMDEGVS